MPLSYEGIGKLMMLRGLIHEQPEYKELVHLAEFMIEQAVKA
jgi:hypothetical protein